MVLKLSRIANSDDVCANPKSLAQSIAELDLFSVLSLKQINLMVNAAEVLEVARGDVIFREDGREYDFYLLLEGQIKLAVVSLNRVEKVICLVESGQSFGEERLFSQNSVSPLYAQATLDSKVLRIPRNTIFSVLDANVKFARCLLMILADRNCQLVKYLKYISLQSSTQRLISFLLQNNTGSSNVYHFRFPATKQTVASILNLTPETFSRAMLRLSNSGFIEINGKEVVINNVQGLRDFI